MKTGSKYIHLGGRRMELWIMTAWLVDNHLLTCLTLSWPVCPPASVHFVRQSQQSVAMYLPRYFCQTLWLFYFFSFSFISCLCFSSSTSIDQPVQYNPISLHRELSCIPRFQLQIEKKRRRRKKDWEIKQDLGVFFFFFFFFLRYR